MPKRQRLGWYSFYKKSLDTIRAVIPNPPPIRAKPPVRLPCGTLYFDLSQPVSSDSNAPIIQSRLGTIKTDQEVERMKELRKSDPNKWTIHALSTRFAVSRSFVISSILTSEERAALEKESEEYFLKLPMSKVKGALLSARNRQVRENAT